jgi:hypothetical protein
MNKETVEQAALEYLEKVKSPALNTSWQQFDIDIFKAGADWQKEQLANNAIEFAIWTHQNLWACLNNEPTWYNKSRVYQYKTECLTSQQLYELWQESKNK